MIGWVQDHWEFLIGTLIGLSGVIALYYQRRPNTLDFRILLNTALLSPHASSLGAPLTVNFMKTPMKQPHVVKVRIVNTGKHAVLAEHFVDPIAVKVTGADVVNMFVPEMSTPGIINIGSDDDVQVPEEGLNTASFRPPPLNPGDWFKVQEVCEGAPKEIGLTARFANQSRPMAEIDARKLRMTRRIVGRGK